MEGWTGLREALARAHLASCPDKWGWGQLESPGEGQELKGRNTDGERPYCALTFLRWVLLVNTVEKKSSEIPLFQS